ncbi:MAG: prepilin-type N-terminal cleavage/methylation domain-containing protein [Cytophagales bacterium]|nr:prepilin-type N-terminal cleavage/methylation domain-containing protein [Rhizobacter sp.]
MNTLRRQRGITLIEALVGFLILSLGLLGALRLQSWLRLNGDVARQRTEAVRLAQQDMEQLRAFANTAAFQGIAAQRSEANATPTHFSLTRIVSTDATLKSTQVRVNWQNRAGEAHVVQLHTNIVGVPPVYSAALALPPQDKTLAPRRNLPAGAKRLIEGRSVLKPSSRSAVAWVINNSTGVVTAQCNVPATLAARDITEADLSHCTELTARLLRGFIRFSLSVVPDALNANDTPLTLSLTPASAHCETEVIRASERYLTYTCLQPVSNTEPLHIVPNGWAFGNTASTYKACRFTPAPSNAPQNYLVIRGDAACPQALTPHNGVSVATVQHQP